ncbi:MAG: exo-alpha-sialidase [Thermoplasmata archaeon]|nr:exo-alpha-sialidase [Thermoplasmata archaeon]
MSSNNNDSREPVIAVEGNRVYVLWLEFTTPNLWLNRSEDGGKTWLPGSLIVAEEPRGSLALAVDGPHVYALWTDSRSGPTEVYFIKSTDYGDTWGTEIMLSQDYAYPSESPDIAVWEDNLYVVFDNWTDIPSNPIDVMFIKSEDRGETWLPEQQLTISNVYSKLNPLIAVNGTDVHIVYGNHTEGCWEVYYTHSANGGQDWSIHYNLSVKGDGFQSYLCDFEIEGEALHLLWSEENTTRELYYKRSLDNGQTWSEGVMLSDADEYSMNQGSLAVENGNLIVAWDDNKDSYPYPNAWEIYCATSDNGGETWTPASRLTTALNNSLWPEVCIKNERYHVVWFDNRTGTSQSYYKRAEYITSFEPGVKLVPGYNCIGLPGEPPVGWTARNLAVDIEGETDLVVLSVSVWDSAFQRWRDFVYRSWISGNPFVNGESGIFDFELSENTSLFVQVNGVSPVDTTWNATILTSYASSDCPGWDLRGGWNPVALPYNSSGPDMLTTSQDIIDLSPNIVAVADWNETTQQWILDNGTGDTFPLRWSNGSPTRNDWNYNGVWVLCDLYGEVTHIEIS